MLLVSKKFGFFYLFELSGHTAPPMKSSKIFFAKRRFVGSFFDHNRIIGFVFDFSGPSFVTGHNPALLNFRLSEWRLKPFHLLSGFELFGNFKINQVY